MFFIYMVYSNRICFLYVLSFVFKEVVFATLYFE